VTRVRNLDEFRESLGRLFVATDRVRSTAKAGASPRSAEGGVGNAADDALDEWLECHVREYFIDRFLAILNWQKAIEVDAAEYVQGNVTIEQDADFGVEGVPREGDERRKRLDYFGFERDTDQPLLVVEAKRPSVRFPGGELAAVADKFRKYLVKSRRRRYSPADADLTAAWGECLDQVREYARSVFSTHGRWPQRVAVCNGRWLVIFVEPHLAFGTTAGTSAGEILLFESRDAMARRAADIWRCLEYGSLASSMPQCLPSEIGFLIDRTAIDSCMFGLKVLYAREPSHFTRPQPCILVVPTLLLRSSGGSFLKTGFDHADDSDGEEFELPNGNRSIDGHLAEVRDAAERLKRRVEEVLHRADRPLPLVSVEAHMHTADTFAVQPTVVPIRAGTLPDGEMALLVITGAETHFVRSAAEYRPCIHHRHGESDRLHVAQFPHAMSRPSKTDHSHFSDGSEFHCTHREVFGPKGQQVTRTNRDRCGPRSCEDNAAFCELWRLEHMLCCRTCVFQTVCTASQVFILPCPPPLVQITVEAKVPASVV
jgi:hypothetical protein